MPDKTKALNAVMAGREERAAAQSHLILGRGDHFVCQISLNIPGFPKRLDGDENLIERCAADTIKSICCEPLEEVKLENGAGLALLMLFKGGYDAARSAKYAGVSIEEGKNYGRAVDIDIITKDGPLSRRSLCLEPRLCLLCGKDSKDCARERRHPYEALRTRVRELINAFRDERG